MNAPDPVTLTAMIIASPEWQKANPEAFEAITKYAMTPQPYAPYELVHLAWEGHPVDPQRVLATFADPDNWTQCHGGDRADGGPTNCNWCWTGPVIPPYELAERAMKSS